MSEARFKLKAPVNHSDSLNEVYLTMVFENPMCQAFCCELLMRYEDLLQRFTKGDSQIFQGNEINAFVALSNIANRYDSSGVKL
jgi:hypothetical protein